MEVLSERNIQNGAVKRNPQDGRLKNELELQTGFFLLHSQKLLAHYRQLNFYALLCVTVTVINDDSSHL